MILLDNLSRLRDTARASARVLDVGGWYRPFNLATHVVDIAPYDTRQTFHALDPEDEERFSAETWCQIDACNDDWPFEDDYFDFSICSHTLEDVPDPITICRQLNRVSKAGYLEVPSRLREIYTKQHWSGLRARLGMRLDIGFPHHQWICDIEDNKITFRRKEVDAFLAGHAYVTRAQIGRKLTQRESGLAMWWTGDFDYAVEEPPTANDLTSFRDEALRQQNITV